MSDLFEQLHRPVGDYPEKTEVKRSLFDQKINRLLFSWRRRKQVKAEFPRLLDEIQRYGESLVTQNDQELQQTLLLYRQQRCLKGLDDEGVIAGFALVREFSGRVLGLRHHDCQLQGGWVMLNGMVAEMETGEGKTITAALPAAVFALSGFDVHVVTVNDYLAQRDADILAPLYQAMGLTVGRVIADTDMEEKPQAYACHITYCTNKTLVFDYLRDRMTLNNRNHPLRFAQQRLLSRRQAKPFLLRGLTVAIVDEIDSILIDEARTPLVISGQSDQFQESAYYRQALELAMRLERDKDYQLLREEIKITPMGEVKLEQWGKQLGEVWTGPKRRRQAVKLALQALHLFNRDEHYIVQDGKIIIIDENTGRVMPDRFWGRGLQQLIEIKEGCELSGNRETLAKISYQRFFRRYYWLAGMTGTAREISNELYEVYDLPVVKVPTFKPGQRKNLGTRVYANQLEKWRRVTDRIVQLQQQGRPVLVGTRTIEASEQLSRMLHRQGVDHQLLNARQDQQEADIVAAAGKAGRVTISTNMAGRGTDIPLDKQAEEAGGLHVILTEAHASARIDRQLFGRCARQGQPGSFEAIMALDDSLVSESNNVLLNWLQRHQQLLNTSGGQWLSRILIERAQKRQGRMHYKLRQQMLEHDQQSDRSLAFSGYSE